VEPNPLLARHCWVALDTVRGDDACAEDTASSEATGVTSVTGRDVFCSIGASSVITAISFGEAFGFSEEVAGSSVSKLAISFAKASVGQSSPTTSSHRR
jgi:hypothetical protein